MSITQRIDAITAIPPAYRHPVLPAPRSVKIELTANCNYKCRFCVKSLRPDNGSMDRKFFSRIIREMREAGVEELGLFYIGESMLCPWLPEAIAEAKAVGYPYTFLTTNGSAATPQMVAACMKAGLDSLKFSINFADAQQLSDVAQVTPRFFEQAIDHLRAARQVRDAGKYATRLYASSIAFDGEQGEKMRRVVARIEPLVDEFYWLPLYGMSGASKAAGWKPKPGNPGRLDAMRESLPCWSVFTEGHITVDGSLSACCFGNGLDDSLKMADLNEVSFMEGWNSLGYQKLRAAHLTGDVSNTACAECATG